MAKLSPIWLTLALLTAGAHGQEAGTATAPADAGTGTPTIEALRDAVQDLRKQVAAFGRRAGLVEADPSELAALRRQAEANLRELAAWEQAIDLEPQESEEPVDATAAIRRELIVARRESAALRRQQAASQRTIVGLQGAMAVAAAEIGRLRAAGRKNAVRSVPVVLRRDPQDAAALDRARRELGAAKKSLELIARERDQLQLAFTSCSSGTLLTREVGGMSALVALRRENALLRAEAARAGAGLTEALLMINQCADRAGNGDDRLDLAVRQIEALEAALSREQAAHEALAVQVQRWHGEQHARPSAAAGPIP